MNAPNRPRPVILCVLDGWGQRDDRDYNAIAQADPPVWKRLMARCPHALLDASESEVGLPEGQMGNSEVGHLNLGAGRIVMQELPRINAALKDGSLADAAAIRDLIARLQASGGTCHLMGLLSPGGVHSHQDHMAGLARILDAAGVPVTVHCFLDGRDTPPRSAKDYMARFLAATGDLSGCRIGTVSGRYYAMDRDKRWERTALAYEALVAAKGIAAETPLTAIEAAYERGESDEFVKPTIIAGYAGMRDGDGVLMANFRADRARQILAALLDPGFTAFPRTAVAAFARAVGMVEYAESLNPFLETVFPPERPRKILAEIVSAAGLAQLHIAETEKYAHVTFFFNGGEEAPFPGEERILVPSPKVATYDLQPEMSAPEVTDRLITAIESGRFDFIIVNYANPDMVGHTGDMAAAIAAVRAVDACLGRLVAAVERAGGALLITADHGNIEFMRDPETGQPHTAHTMRRVPLVLVNGPAGIRTLADGRLADVAPTILELMALPKPREMTGRSRLVHAERSEARAAAPAGR